MRWTATQAEHTLNAMHTATTASKLPPLDEAAFVARLGSTVEHAPWVARAAWQRRPFADADAVFEAMRAAILAADRATQHALLCGHPELAGREAVAGEMTDDSTSEQGRLGLLALTHAQWTQLQDINQRYRQRFGIPLIVALRLHESLASVLDSAAARLKRTPDEEWAAALDQVCEVMRGRLQRALAA
jgi:2-oxo-4-hydroxy-4-carboxy-5-ureidoimidazoline decarboxylase